MGQTSKMRFSGCFFYYRSFDFNIQQKFIRLLGVHVSVISTTQLNQDLCYLYYEWDELSETVSYTKHTNGNGYGTVASDNGKLWIILQM